MEQNRIFRSDNGHYLEMKEGRVIGISFDGYTDSRGYTNILRNDIQFKRVLEKLFIFWKDNNKSLLEEIRNAATKDAFVRNMINTIIDSN